MDWQVTHHPNYWGATKLAYPDVPKQHPRFAKCMVAGMGNVLKEVPVAVAVEVRRTL